MLRARRAAELNSSGSIELVAAELKQIRQTESHGHVFAIPGTGEKQIVVLVIVTVAAPEADATDPSAEPALAAGVTLLFQLNSAHLPAKRRAVRSHLKINPLQVQ
eukprot:COSAG04_NODE_17165_length_477_cov_0.817460_1_plen_104_part_10